MKKNHRFHGYQKVLIQRTNLNLSLIFFILEVKRVKLHSNESADIFVTKRIK
jgi:hypothetical protein